MSYAEIEGDFGDDGGLYVNFSAEEAASESKDLEPLPSGKYLVTITKCDLTASQSVKNFGKPYYKIEFTVAADMRGGTFEGRKCWTNAMLFSPALFTITHLMKACGFGVSEGRVRIPDADEFIGKILVIGGVLKPESRDKKDPSKVYSARYEPMSYFPADVWKKKGGVASVASAATPSASSLLS